MPAEMPFDDVPEAKTGLLAGERAGDNAGALSVSEISALLKRHVETGFAHVRIRGEISGFKRAASGHLYLALKDENALIEALEQGRIAGAGLDVYANEPHVDPRLLQLSNTVLLPHMGSATIEGRIDMGEKVIINIKTFADGHRPPDLVVPGML